MATLQSILKSLIELYNEPFVDEQTYYDAASWVRAANKIVMLQGIEPEQVSEMIMPSAAIALVSGYINKLPTQSTESLTMTALAKALGRRRSDVAALFKAGKIPAFDTSTTAKPNYCFNLDDVRKALEVKPAAKSTRKQAPSKPFLV